MPNSTQLLTLGGALDLDHATCDWEWHGVAVLDVWSVTWNSDFDAAARPYKVSQGVAEVVGGGDEGGATLTAPAGGWETAALAGLFKQSAASATSTAAAGEGTGAKGSKTGAIVGGVVGGVGGVALVALLAFFLLRRRRRRMAGIRSAAELDHTATQRHEAVGSRPDKPRHDDGFGVAANAELPGDVGAQELDGEDQFERIVELDAGADAPRFEMAGSGMSPKEGEARGEEDTLKRLRGETD